ncbi:hypothetical protein GBB82_10660 [Bifidobacterium longum]|nr:hypothetical protein GBB82_10660 [Bifidobacterium longum]
MLLGTKRERTGDKKGANRGQKGSEPGTKRERTGDKKGANRGQKGSEPGTLLKCVSFLIEVGTQIICGLT